MKHIIGLIVVVVIICLGLAIIGNILNRHIRTYNIRVLSTSSGAIFVPYAQDDVLLAGEETNATIDLSSRDYYRIKDSIEQFITDQKLIVSQMEVTFK